MGRTKLLRVETTYAKETPDGVETEYLFVGHCSPSTPARFGSYDTCQPAEGGECEKLEVFLDGVDLTPRIDELFTTEELEEVSAELEALADGE
jgi:hypothetical protein